MYGDQNGCSFDPEENGAQSENGFSQTQPNMNPQLPSQSSSFKLQEGTGTTTTTIDNQTGFAVEENLMLSMEEFSYHQTHHHHHHRHPPQDDILAAATSMDMELQHQLALEAVESSYNSIGGNNNTNWVDPHLPESPYFPAPDLLNLFNLPRCSPSSLLPNSSSNITFTQKSTTNFQNSLSFLGDCHHLPTGVVADSASASSVLYDPLFHLNLPPQPPLFRELFQSLPNGHSLPGSKNGSLFSNGGDEMEADGGVYQEGSDGRQFENGVFEFTAHIGEGRDGKGTKHLATERQRRVQLNDKYRALRSLVPNPTKNDRASVVGDAIEYIRELLRTVNDLQLLVERKRCGRERIKRQKTEEESAAGADGDVESSDIKPSNIVDPADQSYNSSLRSTWLQRKSKDTEVDIRIVDDEVTIKLAQRKKINLLLFASKVLNELQLDLHHVAGGHVGDYYSFLFNSKIYEGSSLYASAIANKLIEVLDSQYAAVPPTNSY
ncbi:hypothetical protein FEM48_Zijuj06G0205100 [Ziziphus jujuba var. spinosa]|uniref:BHLH domain-containing protein n=1 Tax=Ziziphus jujuba var. spinosa TaxID=714518 RepID=A0A978VBG5_ZIZJJ|nr:hypothetical protein FEM48_Zijuj06G0205100 [Ziziphus jujuba var. spinosa]